MNTYKYLITSIAAIAVMASCQPKGGKNYNKTTNPDSSKTADTSQPADMPGDKPVPLSQLIVPGISVGQVAINEGSESVHEKLGRPDAGDAAMGKSVSIWYANHDTTGYQTQIYFSRDMGNDETARVKQIRVTSPFFKVTEDLFTGQPFKTAAGQFKLVKMGTFSSNGKTYTIYDDKATGISFEEDADGKCTGITIHNPGRDVTGTYLTFFPNLQYAK